MRFGQPLPARIRDAPDLWLGNQLYYQGFLDLTSTRRVNMSVGPLSILSVMEYAMAYGIEGEQLEDFIWMLSRLDSKYLEWSKNRGKSD